jgi:hypothetical protein
LVLDADAKTGDRRRILNSTPATALTPPKRFSRPRVSSTTSSLIGASVAADGLEPRGLDPHGRLAG